MKIIPMSLARLLAGALSSRFLCLALLGLASLTFSYAQLPTGWSTGDIGTVGATGNATYSSGTFTVSGAGAEVYGTTDAFRYVYQAVNGDFTITARVATEPNTSQWAKVGLMIRESLAANAAYSFVFITPDQPVGGTDRGILHEYRGSTGASAAQTANLPGYIAPYWLRLARVGNSFTASRSTDGITWTAVGPAQTITMSTTAYIGLVVCSHADPTVNTSTFDNVSVANGVPVPWSTWDVGTTGAAGSASYSGGTFTVNGSGAEVFYTTDAFRFVFQPIVGDCTVIARVASEQNTYPYAKTGLMVRQSLADNSAYCDLMLTPDQPTGTDHGFLFEYRATTGGSAAQVTNVPGYIAPYWLKLIRKGDVFTAAMSADGVTWTLIGTQSVTMTGTVYAGLAVCSHAAGTLNTTTFTNVNVMPGSSLPPGWTAGDVGSIGATGATSYTAGTFIVDGSGANIWNAADAFHFVRQPISGDCTIVARVTDVEATYPWAKGGVMIRESTAANSKYVYVAMTPANGLLFEYRSTTGGTAVQRATVSGLANPRWIKLARTGSSFAASYSSDGVTWTTVPNSPLTVSMNTNGYAGLTVTSCADGTLCTATFDNVNLGFKSTFPRLGGVNYGAKNYEDAAYESDMSNLDMVIMGFYKGWTHGTTIRSTVQAMKRLNPNLLVGNYTIMESQYNSPTSSDSDVSAKLTASVGPTGNGGTWTPNDWWAHTSTGAMYAHSGYANQYVVNTTAYTTPDANGQRFPQWMAQRSYNVFFSPVLEFDVWFVDNILYKPREDADWRRAGVMEASSDPTVRTYYRQGNVDHVNAIHALKPGALVMGNIEGKSYAGGTHPVAEGFLRETQYAGLFAGALQESALGQSWSEETTYTNGWDIMMSSYRSLMDNTIAPHLVIFNAKGVDTDYPIFRYAFASALMEDGYFSFSRQTAPGKFDYSNVTWYDEYDLAGTATTTWLGAAVDAKQRTPKSNGVYVRRFQNGMAITNPKGNGTQTINLSTLFPGETYYRIKGTQDPTTNDGTAVTSVTINARDGLILRKQ